MRATEDPLDMPTPFPASLDALRQSLAETELSDAVVAHLVAQARPALVLATSAADEAAIPLGATKIGGSPAAGHGLADAACLSGRGAARAGASP